MPTNTNIDFGSKQQAGTGVGIFKNANEAPQATSGLFCPNTSSTILPDAQKPSGGLFDSWISSDKQKQATSLAPNQSQGSSFLWNTNHTLTESTKQANPSDKPATGLFSDLATLQGSVEQKSTANQETQGGGLFAKSLGAQDAQISSNPVN